jgi:EpsI family protein
LFWLGTFWREDLQDDQKQAESAVAEVKLKGTVLAVVLVVVAASLWPGYAAYLERSTGQNLAPALAVPAGAHGWQLANAPITDWKPRYLAPRAEMVQTYRKDGRQAALYLYAYRQQEQGSELINSRNVLVWTEDHAWGNVGEHPRTLNVAGSVVDIMEGELRGSSQRLLVWYWYHVDGRSTANPYRAKFLEAWAKLSGRRDDAMLIALAAPYDDYPEHAEQTLEMFYREMLPEIEASVKKAAGS